MKFKILFWSGDSDHRICTRTICHINMKILTVSRRSFFNLFYRHGFTSFILIHRPLLCLPYEKFVLRRLSKFLLTNPLALQCSTQMIQSARLSVESTELGPSTSSPASEFCPPPPPPPPGAKGGPTVGGGGGGGGRGPDLRGFLIKPFFFC